MFDGVNKGRTADWKLTALWRNSPVKQRRVRGRELEGNVGLRTCRGSERDVRMFKCLIGRSL